jgi:hypothetical protein
MPATYIQQVRVSPLVSQTGVVSTSFSVQAGDVLVAWGMSNTGSTSAPFTITDSMGLTWTKRAEVPQGVSTNYAVIWTAVVATSGSMSFQLNRPASGPPWLGAVQTWRGVTGIGGTGTGSGTGAPTTNLTTTGDNSAILMIVADNTGVTDTLNYDEVDAGVFTQAPNYPVASMLTYTFIAGSYADAGVAGVKTIGVEQLGMAYSIAAVELQGVVTEILGDAADGYAWYSSTTYNTSREGGGTPTVGSSGGATVGQTKGITDYLCMEGFFKFDVSGMTDFINPNLQFYAQFEAGDLTRQFDIEIRVHNWGAAVEAADFVPGSQLSGKALIGTVNTANYPLANELIPFTIDTAALTSAINAAKAGDGWLYLMASSSYQRTGSAPTGFEYVNILGRDGGTDATAPRLTFALPAGPVVSAELYENGVLKQFLGATEITADGVISFNWNASVLAAISGADVELRLTSDVDIDVGAIEWNAYRTMGAPPPPPTLVETWGTALM